MNYTLLMVKEGQTRTNSNVQFTDRNRFGLPSGHAEEPIVLDGIYEVKGFGTVESSTRTDALGIIWNIYNVDHPAGYKGRSMMVGDIIVIEGVAYYCDSFGWESNIAVTGTAL